MGNHVRIVVANQGNTQGGVHSRILMSERFSGNTRSLRLAISVAEHNPCFHRARRSFALLDCFVGGYFCAQALLYSAEKQ